MERIDNLQYEKDDNGEAFKQEPFFNGPAEFLVMQTVRRLKEIEVWQKIFGDSVDEYKRMDYGIRQLPALRMYNDIVSKKHESWFIDGSLKADLILPASLRRNELQQVQDTLSMALLQQFRRPEFFATMCEKVPGLNELGKEFDVDKSLGFEWGESVVPLTQITINFKLDLRVWDEYLEQTDRTKDSPFEAVLGSLDRIVSTIEGLKDEEQETETEIGVDQTTGD